MGLHVLNTILVLESVFHWTFNIEELVNSPKGEKKESTSRIFIVDMACSVMGCMFWKEEDEYE